MLYTKLGRFIDWNKAMIASYGIVCFRVVLQYTEWLNGLL